MSRRIVGVVSSVVLLAAGVLTMGASAALAAAPTVSAISPTSGPAGTRVVITGTGLSGASSVRLGGKEATFTLDSPTQITAAVPEGIAKGRVRVATPAGVARSATVFTLLKPAVSFFAPTSGVKGTSVTITGTGFLGATSVRFGGHEANFTVDSATQISAIVPADAVSGLIRVAIGASVAKSDSKFTVGKALGIGSFTPTTGGVGTRVVITGRGFSSVTGVRFGGTPASNITVDSTTQITAVVPSGAASGRIEVDSGGRSATTVTAFTVTSTTVRSFSPESGNAGDTVTLVGENLDAVVEVRFTGGATSTFAVAPDGRSLNVQVPAGTVTGSITVVTTDGPTGVGGVFHVLPKLTSISHGAQASHDTDSFSFRLHGEQLSDVVDVEFAGTPVTWSLVDDSEIDVTVPTGGPRWGTFHLTVPSPDGQSIDSPVAGVGIDTVLVVLVSPGGQQDDATPASADFAFNSRANEWFHRVSYGKFAISATATQWLPIAQVSGCDLTTLTNESDAAMRTAGYSPSGYDHVVYYFPDRPACSFLGVATVGGSQVWLDGDLTTDTITHELGHNLGLRHANLLRCTDASGETVTESDTCTTVEYGDPYSVMGGGGSYTASERDYLGWLNGRVTTVTTSGIYSLDPTEIPQSGALALKIPVGNKVYWLEYRYPSDPDTFIEGSACDWQGVQVRESPADNSGISSLLEFGPDTSCASLAWGSSWTDPTGELTIDSLGSPVTGTTGMHVVITLQ